MNYSVELWNSYNKVENRLELHYNGLKDFIYMLSEYYNTMNSFSTNLKKILEIKQTITTNESLLEGINAFKSDLKNQYTHLNEYSYLIKDELIAPLKILQDKINKKIVNNLSETSKKDKSNKYYYSQVELAKKNFYDSLKIVEENKLNYELTKNEQNLNSENKEINLEDEQNKIITSIKKAKEDEKNYVLKINDANLIQEEYIEIKKKNLNEIQDFEIEVGENIKDALRKYIIYKMSYLRNIQYDTNKKSKIIENINIHQDLFEYIYKNSTNATPPTKYEYFSFVSDIDSKKNIPKEIIKEIKNFINQQFNSKLISDIYTSKINDYTLIDRTTEIAYSLNKFSNDDKINITNFINNKKARRYFLEKLIKQRMRYGINLNEISYKNIGDILKQTLIFLDKENDQLSCKYIINLATTLYKTSYESQTPRIFLQNYLLDIPMIKTFEFWKNLVSFCLIEEFHDRKKCNLFPSNKNKDTKIEKLSKIKKIVINLITNYIYHMISFNCETYLMNDIIIFFKEYYLLEENDIEPLHNILKIYINKKNIFNKNIISIKTTTEDDIEESVIIRNETIDVSEDIIIPKYNKDTLNSNFSKERLSDEKTRITSRSARKIKYDENSKQDSIDDVLDNNIKNYQEEDIKSKCDEAFFEKNQNFDSSVKEVNNNSSGKLNSYMNIFNNLINIHK